VDPAHSPYVAENENCGDIDIAADGFWQNGRRCIFDVRITDTECRTTRNQEVENIKKCENSRKKTSICRLVMKCGGISHHWYILLMVVQVERPSRQSGS
jgi:hypothetical protein